VLLASRVAQKAPRFPSAFVVQLRLENYAEGTSKRTMRMSPNCRMMLFIVVPVSKLYADSIRGQLHVFGRINAKHVQTALQARRVGVNQIQSVGFSFVTNDSLTLVKTIEDLG
jgi:hypothetical protein